MEDFVSEPITPCGPTLDTGSMAAGLPGLPAAFVWRGATWAVVERLEAWKQSAPEGGRADGERYLRRHYFRLRVSDGSVWTVYFVRQAPKSVSPKRRWFLYAIERTR